jgi:hypothetical protein
MYGNVLLIDDEGLRKLLCTKVDLGFKVEEAGTIKCP